VNPKFLVFGAGALGSVFGGFLLKSGCDLTFIGLGSHYEEILQNGIKITGIWGDHHINPIRGFRSAKELHAKGEKFDIVLFCVKSIDSETTAADAASLLKPDGIMVSIQNGLNNVEMISKHAGNQRTVGGRIIFGVEIPKPGTVKVTVYADKVLFGEPFEPVNKLLLQALCEKLNTAGIPTEIVPNIMAFIWGKVLYNSALNPLGAILGVAYGKLGENEETKSIMKKIIQEIFEILNAKRVRTPYRDYEDYFKVLIEKQLPPTREHHSSMFQDILHGRKTEIDALNGAIVQYGKELGIPTPYNELITNLIHFKEKNETK
jgi:2-dehydropantoate 2-reductase